jgi:hypothetical protein
MPLPDHLFVGTEGDLYDTRDPDWSKGRPLRAGYKRGAGALYTGLAAIQRVKGVLRAGEFTDVGGYPLYFVTRDGAALSFDAVRAEFAQVCEAFNADASTGWLLDHVAVNYEDADLVCDHTGKPIPSAYGEAA